ncbi:MAG: glutathione S-transferase [Pseudomonadota bacterium]|nr:glutathione S-transferase [Pseudomonadota bacterium]
MLIILFLSIALLAYLLERARRKTYAVEPGLALDIALPHQSEWELYHNDFSLCSKKTRVCLAELGIEHTSHHINLVETGGYENISSHFLSINPAATVPVLVHRGHPIYESHKQIEYAASQCPTDASLLPEETEARQLMDYWVHKGALIGDDPIAHVQKTAANAVPGMTLPAFAAMIRYIPVYKILVGFLFHRFRQRPLLFLMLKLRGLERLSGDARLARAMGRSAQAMATHLDELEELLKDGRSWIVGHQFTLADVGMMVIFERLREVDWLAPFMDVRPCTARYWQHLQARPSYREAIDKHRHPLTEKGTADIIEQKRINAEFAALFHP